MMKKSIGGAIGIFLLFGLLVTRVSNVRGQDVDPKKENKGEKMTIHGWVRDVACLMRHPDALKPVNECALECARAGSPIFIVTKDGTFYLPISSELPDTSQQAKLMPFVGKYVEVSGQGFERANLKAIEIRDIHVADEGK